MNPGNVRTRYASRTSELAALSGGVGAGGDVNAFAARLLTAVGDLLRRAQALAVDTAGVEASLRLLPRLDGTAFLASLSLEEVSSRMTRAADEAVEAAMPEGAEEAETWSGWALEGLALRDRLESISVALQRADQVDAARMLTARLREMDRSLRSKARWFTGLNAQRRAERDLLDASSREAAWWFSSRAECDDFVAWLGGQVPPSQEHLAGCTACRKDLDVAADVERPRERHLSADELWRMDLGVLSRAERSAVDQHAARCIECRRALAALAEGERAISEATVDPVPIPISTSAVPPPSTRGPRTLTDDSECKVLLFRRDDTPRLLVLPKPNSRLAAAALLVPELSRTPLHPRNTPEGFEFELPSGRSLDGARITLRLQWNDGRVPDERELYL